MTILSRCEWPATLAALDHDELVTSVAALTSTWTITPYSLSESGMALLQMRDSAQLTQYFIGEIPLSRAHLLITTETGEQVEGAAQLMTESTSLCETLAICDAILAHALPGVETVRSWLAEGEQRRRAINQSRKAMLKATQVDFSMMDDLLLDLDNDANKPESGAGR